MGKVTVTIVRVDDDTIQIQTRFEGDGGMIGDSTQTVTRGDDGGQFAVWDGAVLGDANSRTMDGDDVRRIIEESLE